MPCILRKQRSGIKPGTVHSLAPIVLCEPGDEVVLETRDAFDG
jgi:hypothetical protein